MEIINLIKYYFYKIKSMLVVEPLTPEEYEYLKSIGYEGLDNCKPNDNLIILGCITYIAFYFIYTMIIANYVSTIVFVLAELSVISYIAALLFYIYPLMEKEKERANRNKRRVEREEHRINLALKDRNKL